MTPEQPDSGESSVPPIGFRRLTDDDLPVLHRWLNEPGVVRWWEGDDVSWERVVADYGEKPDDPIEHWLVLVDGEPAGWIQCYPATEGEEEAEEWFAAGVPRTAAGIDYLIGEPASRGRGLGSAMLAAFVERIVFGRHPGWTHAVASPYAANAASCRALEKAGFDAVGSFDDDDGPCTVLVRAR